MRERSEHQWHHGRRNDVVRRDLLASDSLMQKQHGRKALVVLTDGEDRGSTETLARAIETATTPGIESGHLCLRAALENAEWS
jgi:hypothetical protein